MWNIIMNPRDFKPTYEWENGTQIKNCRALVNRQGKNSTIVIQFLGKLLTSRHGLDYMSWAINDIALENIKRASNPRIKVLLELEPQEDWDEAEAAGRLLNKKQFLALIENYARPWIGRDYCTFGEADLRQFHDQPDSNPNRSIWKG